MKIFKILRSHTRVESNISADQIVRQAREERDRIIAAAQKEAADIIAAARNSCDNSDKESIWNNLRTDHQEVCDGLAEIHRTLQNTNELLRENETAVTREYTKKLFSNLYELHELICDVRDSYCKTEQTNDGQLNTMIINLNEFLDFICDILSTYDVNAYRTEVGEPFDGTIHTTEDRTFYPKTAHIAQSLRVGFRWGDAVLIKEKVSVKQEE